MKSERGFVLIEFIIALPLIIFLLYGLGMATMKIFSTAKFHVADYVLEVETQDALTRITNDLRAAYSVKRSNAFTGEPIDNIEIVYLTLNSNANLKNNIVVMYTQIYSVQRARTHGAYIYAQHQNEVKTSPITGGNFFGDNVVTRLQYTNPAEKVLHVELEMESLVTGRSFKVATAVFMPACETMNGF